MAVDITTLGIQMDTSDLRRGKKDLDAIGDSANKTAGKVTNFTSTATKALGAFAGAFAGAFSAVSVAQKLIETERATGILNSSLITATGSAEKAGQAFAAIQELASRLPESVQSVADAFIKMRNLGLDPSQKAIESYSNTAAAMGKSLNQMVEAVADAATGEFERLKEFGIKAKKQGDEVSLTFQGVTKTIGNSSEEITKYLQDIGNNNFAGAAAARMETLDGAISNLQDSWDGLFRTINSQGAGSLIADNVRAAADAVQDLSDAIGSGQLAAYIDSYQSKFQSFADAGSMAFEMVRVSFDSLIQNLGAGNNVADFIVGAFRDMPENIAAFIKIAAVEIAVLVDKAMIYGEQIALAMNPASWFGDMPDISGAIDAVNDAREQTIAGIMQERDMAIQSYDYQIKAADDLLLKYNEEKAAVVDLGKFKIEQSKASAGAISEEEKKRAKSVAASIAQIEKQNALYGSQSKYAETLYDIQNGLLKVTDAEKVRYLAAARAADQLKIIGDEWNETLRLMEDFDNPFDNEWVDQVKRGGDTISNMWERIDETASDAWVAMFDGFDGLMDGIQNVFKRTLAEMAHEALTKPILLNIQQGGIGNIGAGIGSGAGLAAAGVIVGAALISEWNDSMDKKLEELSAEYKQASQSTGTLLAAGNEKSNSINNAISELGDISGDALNVNRAMLGALNDIRDGIGKASAIFGRTGISGPDVGGLGVTTSDTRLGSALGIGTSIGDVGSLVAGVGKVFGGTVGGFIDGVINSVSKAIYSESKSVIDSGIQFTGQTLAEVLAQGAVDALSYATVQTKEKFLGITTKNNASVQTGELDSDLTRQLGLVFGSASDALEQAALSFGLDFNDYMGRLVIDPMKLSLKDLSGDELTAEIDAFFSSTLDVWAKEIVTTGDAVNASVSILDKFQKVGEGAFETVTRLSSQLNTFNSYVDALSLNFNATGFSAVAASQAVADYAGGFDRLGASLSGYYENFFSESERSTQQMQLLTTELNKIGVDAVPATREAFRELISGLDLTVESEQKQFAALINLQGVFSELVPLTEAMAGASKSLSEIASERYSLETQLLQLNGDTVALRERERELLHESNRTLYDNIKGLEDSIAAAKERYESEKKIADDILALEKSANDEIFNLNRQYFDLTATESKKRYVLISGLLSDEARAIQNNIYLWQDQQETQERAAKAAAEAANELAQKQSQIASERYGLETQLLQVQGKNDELRARELLQLDESNRSLQLQIWAAEEQRSSSELAAKAAEKEAQEKERAADEQRKAQERLADDAAKAQQKALDDARKAAEEQRKLAQGVHDSISDALRSLMGESEAFNQMGMSQARQTLQGALGVAQKGGSLVGYAGLDEALGAIQNLDASRFSSAFEYNQAMGQNIGLLSQLEQYTRVNGSHANGLDYVPFDGYVAQLHKGERVMTSTENKGQSELISEIRALRSDLKAGDNATNGKMLSLLRIVEKWDGDGLPLERVS